MCSFKSLWLLEAETGFPGNFEVWAQTVIFGLFSHKYTTKSPGPYPRRFSKWRIVGGKPWQRLGHVVQNLQKILEIFITWHFEKTKTKWQPKLCSKLTVERENIMHEAVIAS